MKSFSQELKSNETEQAVEDEKEITDKGNHSEIGDGNLPRNQ
jgi:hypothetical protein